MYETPNAQNYHACALKSVLLFDESKERTRHGVSMTRVLYSSLHEYCRFLSRKQRLPIASPF